MADATIITAKLDDKELKKSIKDIADTIETKITNDLKQKFDSAFSSMTQALNTFSSQGKQTARDIKDAFTQMGMTFNQFAKAMQKAAAAASGAGGGSGRKSKYNPYAGADATLGELEASKRKLEELRKSFVANGASAQRLSNVIGTIKTRIKEAKTAAPKSVQEVLGMNENSLSAIEAKMKAIRNTIKSLDYRTQGADIDKLSAKYSELSKRQTKLLSRYALIEQGNKSLARSFQYLRNRILYVFTFSAIGGFIKQLYQVRGEYEMLERSIGILIGNMERGTQIFNELNEMALKSPFTLIELGTAAKQLTAYNFAADEVVDMTRRLADIGAALGVPMERLVYNLGQIRAQTVLNARDARDFANAGFAIVPMLAKMYTEQKRFGDEVVTTAKVYDMMSKKQVAYADVLAVIKKQTDEGGKFFDFQARQADVLKVQLANLTLAWNNMLNDMGKSTDVAAPIKFLKSLLLNWRQIIRVIGTAVAAWGAYKSAAMLVALAHKAMALGQFVASVGQLVTGLGNARKAQLALNIAMRANPIGLLLSLIASLVAYFGLFNDSAKEATLEVEAFGESGAKSIRKLQSFEKILKATNGVGSLYTKTIQELNQVLSEHGIEMVKESDNLDVINEKRKLAIELIEKQAAAQNYANKISAADERYSTQMAEAQQSLEEAFGKVTGKDAKIIKENASVLAAIVNDAAQQYSNLIADGTEKSWNKFTDIVQERIERVVGKEVASHDWGIFDFYGTFNNQLSGKQNQIAYYSPFAQYYADIQKVTQEYKKLTDDAEKYRQKAEEIANSGRSLEDQARAYRNELEAGVESAMDLYNKIYNAIKLAKENSHNAITFDLKLVADNPPAWMKNIDIPELKRLATYFTSLAQTGNGKRVYNVNGEILTQEQVARRGLEYASAAYKKEEEANRKAMEKPTKTRSGRGGAKKEVDEFTKAVETEIRTLNEAQKLYKDYLKMGLSSTEALEEATAEFGITLDNTNQKLQKFGAKGLLVGDVVNMDNNGLLAYYQQLGQVAANLKKEKAVDELAKVSAETRKTIREASSQTLVESINNELGKVKEEYELALDLDANPELAFAFQDIFKETIDNLPQTFGEALARATSIAESKLQGLGISGLGGANLLGADLKALAKQANVDPNSEPIQALIKQQETFRDIYKKNLLDTEKDLDDLVKKYGGYAARMAEIEADRMERLKRLNNAYSESQRGTAEYANHLQAIENAYAKDSDMAKWDFFKNSDDYITMFEDLGSVSTSALRSMRDKLRDMRDSLKNLDPTQLKEIVKALEKLDEETIQRNPFEKLGKTIKGGIQALRNRNKIQDTATERQNSVTAQEKFLTELQIKRKKASEQGNQEQVDALDVQISGEEEILELRKKRAQEAKKEADANKEQISNFKKALSALSTKFGNFANAVVDIRDTLAGVGVDLGDNLNAAIDGIAQTNQGFSDLVSSVLSLNPFGVVASGVKMLVGVGKTFAGFFGGNMKDYYTGMKEQVDRLNAILDKAVDYQLKKLGELSGPQAVKEYENLAKLNKMSEESYRDLARAGGRSGSSWGSHSYAHRTNERLANDWARLSAIVGTTVDEVQDFYRLDYKQLQDIITYAPDAWGKLSDEIREPLEKVAEAGEKAVEYADKFREAITSISFSNLESNFESMLNDWAGDSKNLLDDFDKNAKQAIVRSIMKDYSSKALENWLDRLSQRMADGSMSDAEYRDAQKEYNDIVTNSTRLLQERARAAGLNLNAEKELSALQQGIQGITENTAGAIEAYLNSVSQQVYYHSDVLTQMRDMMAGYDFELQNGIMSQMLLQLQQSYQVQMAIQNILVGWSNPSGQAVRVEMI